MSIDRRVVSVIEALYATTTDDATWPAALSALAALMDSEAATFWVLTAAGGLLPQFTFVNLDPVFVQDYLAEGAGIDPTVQHLLAHPDLTIVHDGLVIPDDAKDRHPYFDWQSKYSDMRHRLVGQVTVAPGIHAGVALHRSRRIERFGPEDLERFTLVYRHLEQALKISSRLGTLGALQRWNRDVIDGQPSAIVLLDDSRRIVYMNARAQALSADPDGVSFGRYGLTLMDSREDTLFQSQVADAIAQDAGQSPRVRAMRATRPSGRRAFGILISSVARSDSPLSTVRPAACVVISDPEASVTPAHDLLQSAFGLTGAEAALAGRLAAGDDLKTAADLLGITYGTARTRLADVFQKTDTRRQGELIRLLLTTLNAAAIV